MKDPEFAQANMVFAPEQSHHVRRNFAPKKVLTFITIAVCIVGAMFGIGMAASYFERSVNSPDEMVHSTSFFNHKTRHLAIRDDSDHGDVFGVDGHVANVVGRDASDHVEDGIRVPISTQTAYETFYSVSKALTTETEVTTQTSTHTKEVVVTPSPSSTSEEYECSEIVTTEIKTTVVTVTVTGKSPTSSPGYATVTGQPSTVTNVDTSLTGFPVVTVSGTPSTMTELRTDISYTSSPPDATVSGNPSTVTQVDASYSLTTSVVTRPNGSKVTVVITDLWGTLTNEQPSTTITTVATRSITSHVMVTVSDLYPSIGDETTSSEDFASSLKGTGWAWSTTSAPYPTNGTAIITLSGTVTSVPGPSTPAIVSGSDKHRAWNLDSVTPCTILLIATVMFML